MFQRRQWLDKLDTDAKLAEDIAMKTMPEDEEPFVNAKL